MKCQDILQNELHEKYILDQLDGSEKEKYELHLKECKDCQAELKTQRTLISGIREAGVAEMKNEIKRQVEIGELNHPGITWGRLSKIAAVLFIFVLTPGVIIYLSKSNPELVPTAEQKTENAPEDISYSVADAATEGRRDIMSTEMMPDADLKVLKIPKQKDAGGKKIFKKNESPKSDALKLTFGETKKAKITTEMDKQEMLIRAEPAQSQIALQEEVSTFKNEKEDAFLKSNLPATPKESRLKDKTGDLNQPKIEAVIFSSREYRSARTYVYEAPEAGLKTDQSRQRDKFMFNMKKSTEHTVSDLRFISNGHAVLVHLKASEDEAVREVLAQSAEVRLPKSFAVEIITQDSLNLEMTWLVGSEFFKMNPEEIKVEILNEQIMRITIENKYIYETELSKNTNTAILKE
ncbi:zf-HC2 domain-containing protein [candidate division KSB1 bacterium]|nr:zf-HC2 domain-containing protein [candidate division KSB1 bacterium]